MARRPMAKGSFGSGGVMGLCSFSTYFGVRTFHLLIDDFSI